MARTKAVSKSTSRASTRKTGRPQPNIAKAGYTSGRPRSRYGEGGKVSK
jgi:hypothetical protein